MPNVRFNELQFYHLAAVAKSRPIKCGYLYKKSGKKTTSEIPGIRWQKRWCALYYNLLFYYEFDTSDKPQGFVLLEGAECLKVCSYDRNLYSFLVGMPGEGHRQFLFASDFEKDIDDWIEHITESSAEYLQERNKELKERLKDLEGQLNREREAKARLQRECADQWSQVARLKMEVSGLRSQTNRRNSDISSGGSSRNSVGSNVATIYEQPHEGGYSEEDLRKIQKNGLFVNDQETLTPLAILLRLREGVAAYNLQSHIRGWIVRKRWSQIVERYLESADGEMLIQRNRLIWQFVISEEDYVHQLTTLVVAFYRPFKMAADARSPCLSREDVDLIFCNCEVILMLHKMFLEGIRQRLKFWPAVQLDDFMSAMLSSLPIYHEYIRNHPYALQMLSQCKRRSKFLKLLSWYESKPECNGQTIEQFLHYPVRLIPNYIRTLYDLLELTPEDHPEKETLQGTLTKLEELHLSLNAQLSEGESIRHTLEIERMIEGGCDALLDTNQKFIRHGILKQFGVESRVLSGVTREKTRHCFLFSRHLIVASRTQNGNLRLARVCGQVPLKYTTLIEEAEDESVPLPNRHLAFTLQVQSKTETFAVTLMAARPTDKAIWSSDISQCIYNLSLEDPGDIDTEEEKQDETSSIESTDAEDKLKDENKEITPAVDAPKPTPTFPKTRSLRDDSRLTKDSHDIKYGEIRVGSNNLPQILYASVDRLLERLVDPRLPGTDFMDTFLLMYRVFTTSKSVLSYLTSYYHQLEELRTGMSIKDQLESSKENEDDLKGRPRAHTTISTSSGVSQDDSELNTSPVPLGDYEPVFSPMTLPTRNKKWRSEADRFKFGSDEAMLKKELSYSTASLTSNDSEDSVIKPGKQRLSKRRSTEPAVKAFTDKDLRTVEIDIGTDDDSPKPTRNLSVPETDVFGSRERLDVLPESCSEDSIHDLEKDSRSQNTDISELTVSPSDGHERAIDVETPPVIRRNTSYVSNGPSSIGNGKIPGLCRDDAQARLIEQRFGKLSGKHTGRLTKEERRGSVQSLYDGRFPSPEALGKKGKDLSKYLGMDAPSSPTLQRKKDKKVKDKSKEKAKKKDKEKEKEREEEVKKLEGKARSASDSSSSGSQQSEDRKSVNFDEESLEHSPSTQKKNYVKKSPSAASAIQNIKSRFTRDTPRKKMSVPYFPNTKSPGVMKRSISENQFNSQNGQASLVEEDSGSQDSLEDITGKDSPSRRWSAIKDTVLSQDKKKVRYKEETKKSTSKKNSKKKNNNNNGEISREGGTRVSIRAILPNRAPLKIMNILKHWVSKHYQDFERDEELIQCVKEFFHEIKENSHSLAVVKEIVKSMERMMESNRQSISNLIEDILMRESMGTIVVPSYFPDNWKPQMIADNLTLLEHHLYAKIPIQEFISCAWTKKDKETRAPNILKVCRRFNQVANMISYEIVHGSCPEERGHRIEFWIQAAARCRDLNNFNSVLQITGGLLNSSVYRLKKSWATVNKALRAILDDMQTLVSADKSFRRLREALHHCNPPCIPYLGFYLGDLLFMDEGAKNYNEEGLVNFAKMDRISRLIREIKQYQQLRYTLEFDPEIAQYLIGSHVNTDEDELYDESLRVEPREPKPEESQPKPLPRVDMV